MQEYLKIGEGFISLTSFLRRMKRGEEDECWPWLGSQDGKDGYGRVCFVRDNNKRIGAHRVAYIYFLGEVPEGLYVLHSCDNVICCNPKHLWLGTIADNLKDMWKKGRGRGGCRWNYESSDNQKRNSQGRFYKEEE